MNSILIVDDETEICAELQRTLQGLGLSVQTADNFETAQRAMERSRFDAILLEFNLRSDRQAQPRTGAGLGLLRQLRTSGVRTPVLIFTALEGEFYERASFEAGADGIILKTEGIPHLLTCLCAHIRRTEQERGTGSMHRLKANTVGPTKRERAAPPLK